MKEELQKIKEEVMTKIKESNSLKEINELKVAYLGKKRTYPRTNFKAKRNSWGC